MTEIIILKSWRDDTYDTAVVLGSNLYKDLDSNIVRQYTRYIQEFIWDRSGADQLNSVKMMLNYISCKSYLDIKGPKYNKQQFVHEQSILKIYSFYI